MAHSKSSQAWMRAHLRDQFVKQAHAQGFRSRAVFKLKEVDERDRLFKAGMTVLDLGAAPGGWSQYAAGRVGKHGNVIAVDILSMDRISGVTFICGDFEEPSVVQRIRDNLGAAKADLVLSDMAPSLSGVSAIDQPRAMHLAELAFDTAKESLSVGGTFLVKVFQGAGFDGFHRDVMQVFEKSVVRKPKASRPKSREVYLLGKGFYSE